MPRGVYELRTADGDVLAETRNQRQARRLALDLQRRHGGVIDVWYLYQERPEAPIEEWLIGAATEDGWSMV